MLSAHQCLNPKLLPFALFLSMSSAASAQTPSWENVASYEGNDRHIYLAQVDAEKIIRGKDATRFWIRLVKLKEGVATDNPFSKFSPAASGPSLYEIRCHQEQVRILQGTVIFAYNGPGVPLNRPANWEFIVPGSLGQIVYNRICGK